jgi:hypothetical protein
MYLFPAIKNIAFNKLDLPVAFGALSTFKPLPISKE